MDGRARTASDLERALYCVLGLPIDAVDMASVVGTIESAITDGRRLFLSTPNLNFLAQVQTDPKFRETLLDSDLCPADGAPIVWIAQLIGLPISVRVSGADIFEFLKDRRRDPPLKVFFFGGAQGVAARAAQSLNEEAEGLSCVGAIDPGFVSVDELSDRRYIEEINASGADLLIAAVGAKKGQYWLHRHLRTLAVPICAQLGAVINFQAGAVRRAPPRLRHRGGEWLWRIKEEPHLWRRYGHDGWVLLRLVFYPLLPLVMLYRWIQFLSRYRPKPLNIELNTARAPARVAIQGDATEQYVAAAVLRFQESLTETDYDIEVDLSKTRMVDARFLGVFFALRKQLKERGARLRFVGVSRVVKAIFHLNGANFLLREE